MIDSIKDLAHYKITDCQKIVEQMAVALKAGQIDYYINLKDALKRKIGELDRIVDTMHLAKLETERGIEEKIRKRRGESY